MSIITRQDVIKLIETIYEDLFIIRERKEKNREVSNEPYQSHLRKIHSKIKKWLIGMGGNKYVGSNIKKVTNFERSKSAPPLEENKKVEKI